MALGIHGHFDVFPTTIEADKDTELQKHVQKYMKEMLGVTKRFLLKHRKELDALAEALYEEEDFTGEEAVRIIQNATQADTASGARIN